LIIGAWKSVLSELSRRGTTGAKTHASGPDFFGLSDLGVTKVIQVNNIYMNY